MLLGLLLFIGLVLAACTSSTPTSTPVATPQPAQTGTPTSVPTSISTPVVEEQGAAAAVRSRGAELYAKNCQSCHGDQDGKKTTGGASPHNESGHTWHHPDAQLKDWITNGKLGFGQMPPFKDTLSQGDVNAILTFIKTWWTPQQRQSQTDISQRYQEAVEKQKKGK